MTALILLVFLISLMGGMASTSITVTNQYKKEVNVKIQGLGVGGCDIILAPGAVDTSDCWCLWGTLHYSFCAYDKLLADRLYDLCSFMPCFRSFASTRRAVLMFRRS